MTASQRLRVRPNTRRYVLPEGAVQLYLHDPTGNLVEINYPDVTDLRDDIRDAVIERTEQVPQTGAAAGARLYFDGFLDRLVAD